MMGEITILDNHEAFIGVVIQGVVKVVDQTQKEHFFEAKSGFVQVSKNNEIRCIIE